MVSKTKNENNSMESAFAAVAYCIHVGFISHLKQCAPD